MIHTANELDELGEIAGAGGAPAVLAWLERGGGGVSAGLVRLADAAERLALSDLPRALACGGWLRAAADESGISAARARSRRALGQALCYANRLEEARGVLEEARDLAGEAGLKVERALAELTLVHARARLGKLEEAIAAGESARGAFAEAGEVVLAARADVNVGVCERMRGHAAAALEHFGRARGAFAGQPAIVGQIESNTAEALLDLDRFDEAQAAFESALLALSTAGAVQAAAIVEGNLADLASRQGRARGALEHFERARRRMLGAGIVGDAARLDAERAETLLGLGMAREAGEAYERAIEVLGEHRLFAEQARAMLGHARAMIRLGRFEASRGSLEAARGLFTTLGNEIALGRVSVVEGTLLMESGQPAEAERALEAVAARCAERPAERAGALLLLARARLMEGKASAAQGACEEGLAISERLGLVPAAIALRACRARALEKLGERAGAVAELRAAGDLIEHLRVTLPGHQVRGAFQAEHAGVYSRWLSLTLDGGGAVAADEAFGIAERARGRGLLDQLGEPEVERPASRALGEGDETGAMMAELAKHQRAVAALYRELEDPAMRGGGGGGRAQRQDWSARLHRAEALVGEAHDRIAAIGRFAAGVGRPVALDEVRASLGGSVLVEYFGDGEDLSALVVGRGGVRVCRRLASIAGVTRHLADFSFQCARAISRGFPGGRAGEMMRMDAEDELRLLHAAVWAPLESELHGAESVIVVPHGPLFACPFGALLGPVAGGAGVSRTAEDERLIRVCPSASVMCQLAARRARRSGAGTLILGVSDALAPNAEPEAELIAATAPLATGLVGAGATMSAFRAASRGKRLIHIASHARFSPEDPLASGIRFADGWMTPRDICTLDLGDAAVILSACDAGRSAVSAADEVAGFVQAFLVAGASELVLSLWPAHDELTYGLMADVHKLMYSESMGERVGLAGALREARRGVKARQGHPAAWASFFSVGAA